MSAILVTLVVSVLNLCLGYALAMRMGLGPPSVWDAWEVMTSAHPLCAGRVAGEASPSGNTSGPSLLEGFAGLFDDELDALDDAMDDALDGAMADPIGADQEEDASGRFDPDDPEDWDLNEKYIETSLMKLNIAMMKSGARATEIDTRLRAVAGRSDSETIQACRAQLKEDCEAYLAEQGELADRFGQRIGELGELTPLGEEIEMTNLQQAAQIETSLGNLEYMDFESDLESANQRLLEELNNLRAARHRLRDMHDAAFLTIARYDNRLDKIDKRMGKDPLTKLPNRIGLEITLWKWWKQGRHKSRPVTAALFDVDGFGALNEAHGFMLANRILCQLAQLLRQSAGEADLVGRFAGQRFLWVMLDAGPRAAAKNAEQIRQSIQRMTFTRGQKEIRVTVRVGLAEAMSEDTQESWYQKLEAALANAKRAGPNRGCLHNGKTLELIESPKFGIEDIEIPV